MIAFLISFVLKIPVLGDALRGTVAVFRGGLPVLTYLHLARVPLCANLLMLAMPLLCWLGPLRSLTVGAFEVDTFVQAFWSTVIFMTATGGVITIADTFAHGSVDRYPGSQGESAKAMEVWRFIGVIIALINTTWMLLVSCYERTDGKAAIIFGAALGFFFCVAVAGGAWTQIRMMKPVMDWLRQTSPKVAEWVSQRGIISAKIRNVGGAAGLLHSLRQHGRSLDGILKTQKAGQPPELAEGVGRTLIYALILIGMYGLLLVFADTVQEWLSPVSAVYFLVIVWGFIFSAITFVFDRHRVPLASVLLIYFGFMTLWRESDHFYAIRPLPEGTRSPSVLGSTTLDRENPETLDNNKVFGLPARVLGAASARALGADGEEKPVVIITLAGGGIQAAAWPLAALEAIETAVPGFHKSVALISGVSGGSVGAFYYTAAYRGGPDAGHATQAATEAAMASSLSDITFATLRDDFFKAVAPILYLPAGRSVLRDRGLALEQSFLAIAGDPQKEPAQQLLPPHLPGTLPGANYPTLMSWGQEAEKGIRPALIMNGTIVETGERLAFSTVPCSVQTPGAVEFLHRYNADVSVATAARLTATFPFISPAARPIVTDAPMPSDGPLPKTQVIPGAAHWSTFPHGGSFHHVVDGGYFDNSGVAGAMAWLNEACEQLAQAGPITDKTTGKARYQLPKKLIILQMSGFPVRADSPNQKEVAVDAGQRSRGTLFDFISPAQTVVGIRNGVQATLASQLVKLFKQRWSKTSDNQIEVTHLILRPIISETEWQGSPALNLGFLPRSPPLSWHLRQCEQKAIREQVKRSVEAITPSLLATAPPPTAPAIQAPENAVLSVGKAIGTIKLQVPPEAKK